MKYYVYIVLCSDGSLYTGVTNDIKKRLKAHNMGKAGAKYTRGRRPVTLVYKKEFPDKSSALKEEYRIKQLNKIEKIHLIDEIQVANVGRQVEASY
jgi:putative endonuclease